MCSFQRNGRCAMTASLTLPTIGNLIRGLDGYVEGISLWDIVTQHTTWTPSPNGIICGRGYSRIPGCCDETVAIYGAVNSEHARGALHFETDCTVDDADLQPLLPLRASRSSLKFTAYEGTGSQYVSITMRDGKHYGTTLVSAFVEQGDSRFPIWGYPHPKEYGQSTHTFWEETKSLPKDTTWGGGIYDPISAMFLARMWLVNGFSKPDREWRFETPNISREHLVWQIINKLRKQGHTE